MIRLVRCTSCQCDYPEALLHPIQGIEGATDPACPLCGREIMMAVARASGQHVAMLPGPHAEEMRRLATLHLQATGQTRKKVDCEGRTADGGTR